MPPWARSNLPRRWRVAPVNAPRFVPEQLALDQLGRHRRAVQALERRLGATRGPVDGARDELLARASLARHEHAGVRTRSAQHPLAQVAHGPAVPEQLVEVARRAA